MRLLGGVFLHAEFTEPWCVSFRAAPEDCGPFLPEVDHIIFYHCVLEGRITVEVADGSALEVGVREAVVLPHGDVHRIGSDLNLKPVSSHDIIHFGANGSLAEIRSHEAMGRIAFEVGYESEAAFSRVFKRLFGAPPATWRKRSEAAATASA